MSLVRQRPALRNQIHGVLARNLAHLPAVSDLFGRRGRRAIASVPLPQHERDQIESALRLHDALQGEIDLLDRELARCALDRDEVRRLLTIPGMGVVTALSLISVIGDAKRFASARNLVGDLGLDPRVRQSGEQRPRMGHIPGRDRRTRGMLVEAAHIAVRSPGPLRSFYQRVQARRGTQIAIVATARKLAVLCWQLLHNGEDYRHASPRLTASKLRALQLRAGNQGERVKVPKRTDRDRELRLAAQADYEVLVADRIGPGVDFFIRTAAVLPRLLRLRRQLLRRLVRPLEQPGGAVATARDHGEGRRRHRYCARAARERMVSRLSRLSVRTPAA